MSYKIVKPLIYIDDELVDHVPNSFGYDVNQYNITAIYFRMLNTKKSRIKLFKWVNREVKIVVKLNHPVDDIIYTYKRCVVSELHDNVSISSHTINIKFQQIIKLGD